MRYVLILITVAVSWAACNNKKAPSEEFMAINDSQFIKKVYFDSGELFSEQDFVVSNGGETLANGYRKGYYQNGVLESISLYRMGKLDSIQTFFYKSGKIFSVYNNSLGTPIGTMIDYYEDGRPRQIVLKATRGNLYVLRYGRDGKIVYNEGVPVLVHTISSIVKVEEPFLIMNEVVNFPGLKSVLDIKFKSLRSGNEYERHTDTFQNIRGRKVYLFEGKFKDPAQWVYEVHVQLRDESGVLIAEGVQSDTTTVVE